MSAATTKAKAAEDRERRVAEYVRTYRPRDLAGMLVELEDSRVRVRATRRDRASKKAVDDALVRGIVLAVAEMMTYTQNDQEAARSVLRDAGITREKAAAAGAVDGDLQRIVWSK